MRPISERKIVRRYKREAKARAYREVALKGGGAREVARRKRQMGLQPFMNWPNVETDMNDFREALMVG